MDFFISLYTLCIMPRSRLGPENESLQNEADRSIFTSKFVFVLVTKSTQQNPKQSEFFNICFETRLPYRYLTCRPRFDAARKVHIKVHTIFLQWIFSFFSNA